MKLSREWLGEYGAASETPCLVGARALFVRLMVFLDRQSCSKNRFRFSRNNLSIRYHTPFMYEFKENNK